MASTYIVPQVLIRQLISEVSLNTVKNQNVLVIGPNYQLFRFAEEKDSTYIGEYDGSDVLDSAGDSAATIVDIDTSLLPVGLSATAAIPYPGQPEGSVPDAGYTKLFANDVVVELPVEIASFEKLSDGTAGSDLDGRIRFGFAVAGTASERGFKTVVTTDSDDVESIAFVKGSDGKRILACDLKRDIVPGDAIRFTYGDGKVFFSNIVSVFESVKGSGIYDGVRFADTLPEEVIEDIATSSDGKYAPEGGVKICAVFSGVEIPQKQVERNQWNWTTYAFTQVGFEDVYGVVVNSGIKVKYTWGSSVEELPVVSAKFYVQHRDLIMENAQDISSIESFTHVEQVLGTDHPDNPLAFGVKMAALNSGDRLVYFCGVKSDDLAGYEAVLGKASLSSDVYIITPTTMDRTIIDAIKAHVEEMSSAENKLWRIGFVSVEAPSTDEIYNAASSVSGEGYFARFSAAQANPTVHNLLQFKAGADSDGNNKDVACLSDVEVGDVVRVFTGDVQDDWDGTPGYTEYVIRKVISNSALQLDGNVVVDDYAANYKVEVFRRLSDTEKVKYIAAQSSALATRRIYNVFPNIAVGQGVTFGGEFLACAAAGLVSSVLPQQPVTNVALTGITDLPIVYQTYSKAQLDTIAAGGTFIIMQDRPNSQVYVRHQISTDYTSNNLLRAELSVTKNLDSISYYFAEVFAPYIGKYNITPELIDVLRSKLTEGLVALETETEAGLYGPQVLAEGTEILYVKQSEVSKDHVKARVHLNLPVPFNYFDLDLEI